ncbi:hypothetical protein D3C73_1646700 [compost metagenome]
MSYFRVAHLAFRQTYGFSGSGQSCVRIFGQQTVVVRFLRLADGIAMYAVPKTEAVEYD